jgi:hypothetical protein
MKKPTARNLINLHTELTFFKPKNIINKPTARTKICGHGTFDAMEGIQVLFSRSLSKVLCFVENRKQGFLNGSVGDP